MSFNFVSLFSGIGGLDLGLERAGMSCVAQVEIDKWSRAVLRKHWPDVKRYRDVRKFGKAQVEGTEVRLVAGGFPCQDISAANRKGKGLAGKRSGLWFEMLRVIRELRPPWVLAENVASLRVRGADVVIPSLEKEGYSCWPFVVGARHVGAPHKRLRVFLVGVLADAHRERLQQRQRPRIAIEAEDTWAFRHCYPSFSHAHRAGFEGYEEDAGGEAEQPHRIRVRWPSPQGEPQQEWEHRRTFEFPMGGTIDGLPARLVRSNNTRAIKAYGNAVVPQVAEIFGSLILQADEALRAGES